MILQHIFISNAITTCISNVTTAYINRSTITYVGYATYISSSSTTYSSNAYDISSGKCVFGSWCLMYWMNNNKYEYVMSG